MLKTYSFLFHTTLCRSKCVCYNINSSPRDLYKITLLVAKALPKVLEKIYCTHQSLNLPVIVMFYTLSLGIQVQCPMKMLEQTQV